MLRPLQLQTLQAWLTGDVINHHSDGGVTDVAWNKATETLLSGRVPELEPDLKIRTGEEEEEEGRESEGEENKQEMERINKEWEGWRGFRKPGNESEESLPRGSGENLLSTGGVKTVANAP